MQIIRLLQPEFESLLQPGRSKVTIFGDQLVIPRNVKYIIYSLFLQWWPSSAVGEGYFWRLWWSSAWISQVHLSIWKSNQWDFEGLYPHGGLSFLCNKISCFQSEHLECTKQYPSLPLKGKYFLNQNLWRIQILENALTHSTQYGKSIQVTKLEMQSCWWRQKGYEIFQPYCLSILKICTILTFVQADPVYNALEKDIAVVNLYFGSSTVYGNRHFV